MKSIEGSFFRLMPFLELTTCVLLLYYKLLIRTTLISGACKRTHRDTNIHQLNQRIYVRDNPVLLVGISITLQGD